MLPEYLTVAQAAEYLQLSEKTIRRLISHGKIRAAKLSNRIWRIKTLDMEKYIASVSNASSQPLFDFAENI